MENSPTVPQPDAITVYDAIFPLGQLMITSGVLALCPTPDLSIQIASLIRRHATCDWGNLDSEDCRENELSLRDGNRLLSAYTLEGVKVYVITEYDRSVTTVLRADEY